MNNVLSLAGFEFGPLGNYLMLLATVYPAIDPLLVVFCVTRFRPL